MFFDAMGIEWLYEPEGFNLQWRLSLTEGAFPYLPDFRLPKLGLWAEVKGKLQVDECVKLLNAAAALSNSGGGCTGHDGDMVVLGNTPDPAMRPNVRAPVCLHMHKGDLQASPWLAEPPGCYSNLIPDCCIARDWGGDGDAILADYSNDIRDVISLLLNGYAGEPVAGFFDENKYRRALVAARSARFEHEESRRQDTRPQHYGERGAIRRYYGGKR